MKPFLIFIGVILAIACSMPANKKIKIFLAGDSTIAIKETKAYPETGWGMPFVHFWDSTVRIENRAKNGRSTKTFISEGLWQKLYDDLEKGDYVFIQFGHNDESKEKGERYASPDTFKMNLTRFIKDTRMKGAIPVLITPVSRRKFDAQGLALPTHEIYSALVKEAVSYTHLDVYKRQRTPCRRVKRWPR